MASEEAAKAGAEPLAPTAPTLGKKSKKKGKGTPKEGADARQGGDEAAGRVAEIVALTEAGRRALALGDAREALGCFRKALLLCRDTASPGLRRACAFNLGAAYVESGKPKKGLEFLLQSQPSEGESREDLEDLYFNIGAAHEGLRDFPKALECFGKASGHGCAPQAGARAGTQVRMGCCYLGLRAPARAAQCFLDAAQTYMLAASPEAAAVALSRASGSMLQSRRFGPVEIAGVLAQCRSLCESIPDPALRAKLYGDIGLGYSQLCIFSLAAESFQQALALCGAEPDRRREAALLQNLGAAHNALRSFGTALGWHRQAAALHSALGNRRAQGQCFGNLAYACSQLGNHEAAVENYLHALQAFRDSGDVQGQWQVCEGLGSACFHLGHPQKAIGHYKEALTLLSHCQDTPRSARERVVHKLTDAIQHQLCLRGRLSRRGGWAPTPDSDHLQFCSTLPHASKTGSEVSFAGKAQAGDELCVRVPRAHPAHSGPPAGSPTPQRRGPSEDTEGPSAAPGCHSQLRANSNPNTPLRHGGIRPRHCDHRTLGPGSLERAANDPTLGTQGHGNREPRTRKRTLSLICSLV